MIEETTFSKKELFKEVLDKYSIKIEECEVITNGSANIYKLLSKDNQYILKEFQTQYGENDVLKEINAIQFLTQNSDLPLPRYVKTNNNEFYFNHKGRVVIMQYFIDGNICQKNEGDYNQLLESAYYLGKIIKNLEGYKTEERVNVKDWYCDNEVNRVTNKYDVILNKLGNSELDYRIRNDIMFKKELLIDLKKMLEYSNIEKITHKVSHGDYSCLQFIYDDNKKVKAILDFIKVKRIPIVWEVFRSYSYIDKEIKKGKINIQNLVDYTKEIMKSVELNKEDLKYLPYVYLVQLARSTYGYEEYFKNVKNKEELLEFAFYRTNICRELNTKAEEISKKLLELKGE